jgi:hypothetical protein
MLAGAISREVTLAPSREAEFLQVYLYGEALTDPDAFIEVIANEVANGAELVDVELTSMPTFGNHPRGSMSGEQVMVLTFRDGPADQRTPEAGSYREDRFDIPCRMELGRAQAGG